MSSEFASISIVGEGPIERYLAGYKLGFIEALVKYKRNEEMVPEKVSGWGYFISGHDIGFNAAREQISAMVSSRGKEYVIGYITELFDAK